MKLTIYHIKGGEVVETIAENVQLDIGELARQLAELRETDGTMSFSLPGGAGAIVPARSIELVKLSADD